MLAAHYDSVGRGPGASDDGAAVAAILEIARMLHALPQARNDVIFLITDGEEQGLVGAHGFVREHPWAKDVKVAINLEARGTSGPSLMFQTSDDDKWLISLFVRHVSRPTTSSLYAEIYKRLPNDTDFTVFKKYGMEGYNFAFVRFERNYHTKNDNFANADPGSLQHHGQNAWQLLTALAEFDLSQRSPGRAIYCDVLALFVIWWPASINFGLAVGILAVTLAAGLIARRRGLFSRFKWRIFLSVAAPLFAGASAVWWMGIQGDFVDNPLPPIAAYWLLALLAVFVAARYTPLGNIEMWSAWTGVWLYWDTVGLLVAWFVPGASYLFLLPGAIAAIAGLVAACWPERGSSRVFLGVCCLGPVAVGVLWLPIQVLFSDGVSLTMTPVYPLCAALTTVTALPLLSRKVVPMSPEADITPPSRCEGDVRESGLERRHGRLRVADHRAPASGAHRVIVSRRDANRSALVA